MANDSDNNAPQPSQPGFFSFENLRSLAILVVCILALRYSIASLYHVPTASMEPTIKVGDRLLAWKLAYGIKIPFTDTELAHWGDPKRGDIIVFKYPKEPDTDYVKRVIGTPGDRIEVIDDEVYVNGEKQPREEHNQDRSILDDIDDNKDEKLLFREVLNGVDHWTMQNIPSARRWYRGFPPPGSPPLIVDKDMLFVMGDNRDNSNDSRVWGMVPMSYVRGKALFVVWSLYFPRDSSWPVLRWNRFGFGLH